MSVGITYIRTSTFLLRFGNYRILTDPWFRMHLRGLPCFQKPGIPLEGLPPVDAVFASHFHPDHLDLKTMKRLPRRNIPVASQAGLRALVEPLGYTDIREMALWESASLGPVKVTAIPALHTGPEINAVFEHEGTTIFFGGDSRYSPYFRLAGRRFQVDLAILPMGGTLILGKRIVMNPEDAWQAAKDLGAKVLIPCHEGGAWMSVPPLSLHPGRFQHIQEIAEEERNIEVKVLKRGQEFIWPQITQISQV